MGLWRDLNDPLVRAIVGSPVGADGYVGAASSSTLVERVRRNLVPHTPNTAEGRHEALLYGEPQDGGVAESGYVALDLPLNDNGVYACALGTCNPEWDCGGHVVEYPHPSNAAVTAFAEANALPWTVGEGMLNPDETDPAWADMGICTMCGKAGLFGSPHVTVDIFLGATDCGTFA